MLPIRPVRGAFRVWGGAVWVGAGGVAWRARWLPSRVKALVLACGFVRVGRWRVRCLSGGLGVVGGRFLRVAVAASLASVLLSARAVAPVLGRWRGGLLARGRGLFCRLGVGRAPVWACLRACGSAAGTVGCVDRAGGGGARRLAWAAGGCVVGVRDWLE